MSAVERYWPRLLSRVRPLLAENGGPVVMVQIENEYGSFGDVSTSPDDKAYMQALLRIAREALGDKVSKDSIPPAPAA
jgi:beta-galactosidase